MTIKRTRDLLGDLIKDMTDEEVQQLIYQYDNLAEMILRAMKQSIYRENGKNEYN